MFLSQLSLNKMRTSSSPKIDSSKAFAAKISTQRPTKDVFKLANRHKVGPIVSGPTHTLRQREWASPQTLHKLIRVSPTPYVGQLPISFINAVQGSPKQVYQVLDELTNLLRGAPHVNLEFQFSPDRPLDPIQYVNEGSFGTVYQLTLNNHPFALKIYHPKDEVSTHGAFGEIASGLYLSKKKFKDISRFHFGNPMAGWAVYEFITHDMTPASRKGPSVRDSNMTLGDDSEPNSIKGIRIDYGGLLQVAASVKKPVSGFYRTADYKNAFRAHDVKNLSGK